MSGKNAKINKRIAKKHAMRFYKDGMNKVLEIMYGCNFWGRLKIACSILFKIV
ncbi:MAG: hypothetical protein PHN88_15900 [Ignavibacteria bacterium]|nr:hypothetical protein [Ignavibacteria bacterium]